MIPLTSDGSHGRALLLIRLVLDRCFGGPGEESKVLLNRPWGGAHSAALEHQLEESSN